MERSIRRRRARVRRTPILLHSSSPPALLVLGLVLALVASAP
eukprot:CAMPEP_0183322018 /NCGR_PEP_ID=MMETSP0160_2-20130417/70470_1 /TAXON_ID=2839 ORGANISM="Odontella Sinensis, Strain Grunow 1884" /NCGR_SAMPLE_ID=MMETSP0160_2 /ASSEMBLY_ACC=CAM_ASM_000250 /LENGTH=41 /DNA_ID= /DNA_START= /DNA_END= /DNA_ORIENTATION=